MIACEHHRHPCASACPAVLALHGNRIGTCQQCNASHWRNETCVTSAVHEVQSECLSLNKQNDAFEDFADDLLRAQRRAEIDAAVWSRSVLFEPIHHCLSMHNSNVSNVHQAYCCQNKLESLPGSACTVCSSLPFAKQLHQQHMTKHDMLLV